MPSSFISVCQWPILKQHTKRVENKLCSFFMINLHAYKLFLIKSILVYISILFASLLVQVTDSPSFPLYHTLIKPLKTLKKACLRYSLHQSVHLLVVRCFCMVMSFKSWYCFQLVHLYLKCARKIWNTLLYQVLCDKNISC